MRPFRGLTDNDVIVARAGRRGVRAGGEEEEEERSAGPPARAARGLGLRGGKKRKRGGACSQAPSQMGQGVVSRVVSITQVRRHFLIQGLLLHRAERGGGRGPGGGGDAGRRGRQKKGDREKRVCLSSSPHASRSLSRTPPRTDQGISTMRTSIARASEVFWRRDGEGKNVSALFPWKKQKNEFCCCCWSVIAAEMAPSGHGEKPTTRLPI